SVDDRMELVDHREAVAQAQRSRVGVAEHLDHHGDLHGARRMEPMPGVHEQRVGAIEAPVEDPDARVGRLGDAGHDAGEEILRGQLSRRGGEREAQQRQAFHARQYTADCRHLTSDVSGSATDYLSRVSSFVFGTNNAAFVQVMYEQYLRDPASVPEEWRLLFDNGKIAELPVIPTTRAEVAAEAVRAAPAATTASGSAPTATPPHPASPIRHPGLTPITGPAARLVQNMTESLSVPTATSFRDVAVAVLDARRKALNAQLAASGKKISFTHLIGYALVLAAKQFPVMTHAFQEVDGKPQRLDPQGVHLGLAVDVERKDG